MLGRIIRQGSFAARIQPTGSTFRSSSARMAFAETSAPLQWGVAWDLDGTLTTDNSYHKLNAHTNGAFDALADDLRKHLNYSSLKNPAQTAHVMRSIWDKGGHNLIISTNPFVNYYKVVLDIMGLRQEEIVRIKKYSVKPAYKGDKNKELSSALQDCNIQNNIDLMMVDDRQYVLSPAKDAGFSICKAVEGERYLQEVLEFAEKTSQRCKSASCNTRNSISHSRA